MLRRREARQNFIRHGAEHNVFVNLGDYASLVQREGRDAEVVPFEVRVVNFRIIAAAFLCRAALNERRIALLRHGGLDARVAKRRGRFGAEDELRRRRGRELLARELHPRRYPRAVEEYVARLRHAAFSDAAFDDAHGVAYAVAHLARVRDLDADVERHFRGGHALAVNAPRDVEVAPRFEHRLRHGRNIYRKPDGLRSARKREARETKQKRRRGGKFTSALHSTRLLPKGTDTPLL